MRRLVLYPVAALALLIAGVVVSYLATRYPVRAAQHGHLALTGATVLVGADLEPRRGATVLIRDGVIVAVGDDVEVPTDATTIDLDGATLLPGLIDLHVHLGSPEMAPGQQIGMAQWPKLIADEVRHAPGTRRALLRHGVTTVRSVGDRHGWVLELRQLLRDGELEGPRLFAAGPLFTTPGGHPVVTVHAGREDQIGDLVELPGTPEEARRAVRRLAADGRGVDLIKVVQERGGPRRSLEPIAPAVLRAIVDEAHVHGLRVTGHWGTAQDLGDLLDGGADGLEHIGRLPDGWPDDRFAALVERQVAVAPTLAVVEAAPWRGASAAYRRARLREMQDLTAELHAAGGRVVAGSDAGMPGVPFGPGLHRELELLVDSGLTPQEALRAATSVAAGVLGSDDIGVVAPGTAADLVVVDGDPLRRIAAVRDVAMVFRDGRLVFDGRR